MLTASTIAARCAALSSAIATIVGDACSFARRVREARHDFNAINADLLAIKTCLEISQDDFSGSPAQFATALIEAVSSILDYCGDSSKELHKFIMKLSSSGTRSKDWYTSRKDDLEYLRQDISILRSTLDLALDHVSFSINVNAKLKSRTALEGSLDDGLARIASALCKRTDMESEHIKDLLGGSLPAMTEALEKMRSCTAALMEDQTEDHQKRSDSRSDSLEPSSGESRRSKRNSPPTLVSPASTMTRGIGAWLANIGSPDVESLSDRARLITITKSRTSSQAKTREEQNPSRGTFYTESITSGSRTESSGKTKAKKARNRAQTNSPKGVTEDDPRVKKTTHYAPSTTVSSDVSLIHKNITSDKVAIAKGKRKELTKSQRVAVDWDLRYISPTTTASAVERALWEGANPNLEDLDFGFLFIRAAFELPVHVLQLLVEYGADVMRTTSTRYFSAMHAAALGGKLDNVQFLAELGAPIDNPNPHGETPLHLAVRTSGALPIAKYLLEMGADVNAEAENMGTSLQIAIRATTLDARERSMMVELLLAHGAEGELNSESPSRRGKGLSVLGLI